MSESARRLRWRLQWRAVLLLALIWVMLWGEASLLTILGGLLVGWLVSVVFWLAPIRYYGRLRPFGLIKLVILQLWDLAVASVHLAAMAFQPRLKLRPGVIGVRLASNSDLYQVAVAELISIVPGTLVVDTVRRPRILYLHVFHLPDANAVHQQRKHALVIEKRLLNAFASDEEIRAADAHREVAP